MSFHVLHILTHGALLKKESGFLVMKAPDENAEAKKIPIEDLRAVVIAARGVTITSNAFSKLLESNAIILHCDENYIPVGYSISLTRTIDKSLTENQLDFSDKLKNTVWEKVLLFKLRNQKYVLDFLNIKPNPLDTHLGYKTKNESSAARDYWQTIFKHYSITDYTRSERSDGALNGMLNYGYAVLEALVHRSIVIHGLIPIVGIKHSIRYQSNPLVYDLMEPLRPFVDYMLCDFINATPTKEDMARWSKHVATYLKTIRVLKNDVSFQLLDAIDDYINSYATCMINKNFDTLWIPCFTEGKAIVTSTEKESI